MVALVRDDLIRIAAAGGGMEISSKMALTRDDLVRIAAAAASSGKHPKITINCEKRPLVRDDLIRIAAAGGGCVYFINL